METIKTSKDFSALALGWAESLGKEIQFAMTFKSNGRSFSSFYEAEQMAKDLMFTCGSMCGDEPIGLAKDSECSYIAKWRNIPSEHRTLVDGLILSNDFRNGDVELIIFK